MNCLIVYTVALAFGFHVIVAQNESDSSSSSENLTDSAANAGEEIYYDANEIAKEQEDKLAGSVGDMIEYFTKSIADMSNILENIKSVGENNSDNVRTNLVDNLISYVEDTEIMKQQIGRVMQLRAQFQDSILKQLYSLPISADDAAKLESDLREQIKLRADKIPNIQNVMNLPQVPQQVSRFIPSF